MVKSGNTPTYHSLSANQKNIWNLECVYSGTPINLITTDIRFQNRIHYSLLQEAVNLVLSRDVSLRTRIHLKDGEPVSYTVPFESESFPFLDFSMTDEDGIIHWASATSKEPILLYDEPLYRFVIYKIDSRSAGILVRMHHIISDGWTQLMLCNRIGQTYLELVAGQEPSMEEAPSYLEHLRAEEAYFQSEEFQEDKKFWISQLENAGGPTSLKAFRGNNLSPVGKRKSFRLPETLNHSIYSFCVENRIAPFSVFYVALATYLARITGERNLTVGVPVFNRLNFAFKQTSGMFVSTLPLVFQVEEELPFEQGFRIFGEHWLETLRHQRFPFGEMVEMSRRKDDLFHIVLSYQDGTMLQSGESSVRISGNWFYSGFQKEHLCIHMTNLEDNKKYAIDYDFLTQVFTEREIEEIHAHLCHILKSALEGPRTTTNSMLPLGDDLREKVVYSFNRTTKPLRYRDLFGLFKDVENRHPNRVALIESGQRISYSALRLRAGEIAGRLETPGQLVALILPKGIPLFASMIGVLQAGCSYVLVSPDLPAARISEILDDSGADCIITDNVKVCFSEAFGIPVINVDMPQDHMGAHSVTKKDDLAYIVYTSGSTGKPKGVEITCMNLLNLVRAMKPYYGQDGILSICNIEFDAFMLESIVPMLLGKTIIIPEKNQLEDPKALGNLILGYAVGFLATTPSRLSAFLTNKEFQRGAARLQTIVCGGETISDDLIAKLKMYTNARIYNQYGPSETCVGVSIALVNEQAQITAGKPMDNCRLYVLDKWMQPLPVGVPGDLYIGGICVGRGYRNNPALTREKFLPSPFEAGDRLYRTGDVAAWTPKGEIVLGGRQDSQVKIRGVRIELMDIATTLSSHAEVQKGACKVFERNGQSVIIAYYTAEEALDEPDLMRFMAEKLPHYMLPARVMFLEEMPLNANGKVDDKNLPFPEEAENGAGPENRVEEMILDIFSEILGNRQLNMDSDYFLSGGNSLNAMAAIGKIEEALGVRIKISDLYALRSAKLVSGMLNGSAPKAREKKPVLPKAPKTDKVIPSSIQKGIYLQSRLDPTGLAYNMPGAFCLSESVDRKRLGEAFAALIHGDEILRSRFVLEEGELWQIPAETTGALESLEASNFEEAAGIFLRPFDLSQGPLLRMGVWDGDEEGSVLFLDIHHIICDGLSTPILMHRLSELYKGKNSHVNYNFYDYLWHIKDRQIPEKTRAYWRNRFSNPPQPLSLPLDNPRPDMAGFRGDRISLELASDLSRRIQDTLVQRELTSYMFFAGAFGILLSKFSRQKDVVMGSPVSRRTLPELTHVCGPFLETLPLRISVEGTIGAYLAGIKADVLALLDHGEMPIEGILEEAAMDRTVSGNALFRVLLTMRPMDPAMLKFNDQSMELKFVPTKTSKMDLSLEVTESEGAYGLQWEYDTDLFREETVQLLARSMEAVLRDLLEDESNGVAGISAISVKDRIKYIERPAKRVAPYLKMPIDEIISDHCGMCPEELAVIQGDHRMTFGELDHRAREIAGLLIDRGVSPGDKVGLVLRRNLDLFPALLGILMAGAAYVPYLDTQPKKRAEYMMMQADVKLILHDKETAFAAEGLSRPTLDIGEKGEAILAISKKDMGDLIHVLFTSGSTGVPKGVEVSHGAIANLLEALKEIMVLNTGRVLCTSSVTFDVFMTESLVSLAQGFCVVLADEEDMMLPYRLAELIKTQDVRMMQFTPSRLRLCMQNDKFKEALGQMDGVIVAGENMPESLVSAFKKETGAQLMNLYGPTEAAVYVTQGELFAGEPVTIGTPLNNCRIYIVDENLGMLPPLVKGEICIGGNCLAQGYARDPELTKQVFVPDTLFPGERMYRTGDLGKLNLDGTYSCLGRVDGQIKMNGVRVEPQEIIDAMIKAGAEQGAVMPLRNPDGSMSIYGFASPGHLDGTSFRARMSQELPPNMIPAELFFLDSLPHNASGKLDLVWMERYLDSQKKKPEGEPSILPGDKPSAPPEPQDSRMDESVILGLWEEALGRKELSPEISYFEQGGTSLGALGILGMYYNQGVELSMADFYAHPTARGQAALLQGRFGESGPENFREDQLTDAMAFPRYVPQNTSRTAKHTNRIFLTGGSGYLGSHLVSQLLERKEVQLTCLVRPGREDAFWASLEYYFGFEWLKEMEKRILLVLGDITLPRLGLADDEYGAVVKNLEAVYHCAADVRHYTEESVSMQANVVGTEGVIALAKEAGAALHHISTTSVAADYLLADPKRQVTFFEMDFDIGQNQEQNVYVHSKFLAEAAVYDAISQGLDAKVYRIGRLVGRQSDGRFQKNPEGNAFYAFLRAIRLAKAVPVSMTGINIEMTPVDWCARAIVLLEESDLTTWHVAGACKGTVGDILAMAPEVKVVPDSEYAGILKKAALENPGQEITPLLDFFVGSQGEKQKIDVSSVITLSELKNRGLGESTEPVSKLLAEFDTP